jgi:hypothetical protein
VRLVRDDDVEVIARPAFQSLALHGLDTTDNDWCVIACPLVSLLYFSVQFPRLPELIRRLTDQLVTVSEEQHTLALALPCVA